MALPKSESTQEPSQHAMEILIGAIDGCNPIMFAQIAVNRALGTDAEPGKAVGPEMTFHRPRKFARER